MPLKGMWNSIALSPNLISEVLSYIGGNPVGRIVCLPINMTGYGHRWALQKLPNVTKERVGIIAIHPILNPSNDYRRVPLNEEPLSLQLSDCSDDANSCCSELSFRNRRVLKENPSDRHESPFIGPNDIPCTTISTPLFSQTPTHLWGSKFAVDQTNYGGRFRKEFTWNDDFPDEIRQQILMFLIWIKIS